MTDSLGKNGLRTWRKEKGAGFLGDRAMQEKNGEGFTNSRVVPTINHGASNPPHFFKSKIGDLLGKMNSLGVTKPAPFSQPEFERFYK